MQRSIWKSECRSIVGILIYMKQETDKGEMKAAAVKYMSLGTDLEGGGLGG